MEPSEKVAHQLPSKEVLQKYGRSSKVLLAKKDIPDLHFIVNGEGKLPEHSQNSLSPAREVIEIMETNECPQNACKRCSNSLQNSDICEQSGNSLRNVVKMMPKRCEVGVALEDPKRKTTGYSCENQQMKVDRTLRQSHNRPSAAAKVEGQIAERCGESRELSQNSIECKDGSCPQIHRGDDYDGESEQGPDKDSECGEYSPVPRLMTSAEETDVLVTQKQEGLPCTASRRATGGDNSSEFSQEWSNCVGNNVSVPGITWFKSVSKLVGLTAVWQPSKVEGHSVGVSTVGSPKANNNLVHREFNFFL